MDKNGKLFRAKDEYVVAEVSLSGEGRYQVWGRERIQSGLGNRHSFVDEYEQFSSACGQAQTLVEKYEEDHGLS